MNDLLYCEMPPQENPEEAYTPPKEETLYKKLEEIPTASTLLLHPQHGAAASGVGVQQSAHAV
jgi:hypothetical protein